jgi:pimeloyl-ACP methyl ester carboxylesterase
VNVPGTAATNDAVSRREPIAVTVIGSGSSPVLLLHGLGGDHRQAAGLLPLAADVTRIAPDLPGHGDTDLLADEPVSFLAFAELTARALEELRRAGAVPGDPMPVIGISMGAGVALALQAQRPELVHSLALVRPSWLDVASPPNLVAFGVIAKLLVELGPSDGAAAFASSELFRDIDSHAPAMAQSLLGQFSRPHARDRARVLADMPRSVPLPDRSSYAAVAVPTVVIAAPEDPVHPYDVAETLAEWIPGAQLVAVPRKLTDPAEHNAAVAQAAAAHLAAFPS